MMKSFFVFTRNSSKILIVVLMLFSLNLLADWHYNQDGGFGFYQPDGWTLEQDNRISYLTGPSKDTKQSKFLIGSDWIASVQTLDELRAEVKSKYADLKITKVILSDLPGFQVVYKKYTEIYLLRQPENVMLIRYLLQGSKQQREEGKVVLSSIEISTQKNTNRLKE